jgi:hypothetical protein
MDNESLRHTRNAVMGEAVRAHLQGPSVSDQFELHAAKAFFASAWADACDEAEHGPSLSGCEIMNVMPQTIDPAAIHAARTLRFDVERVNKRTIAQLMEEIRMKGYGDRPNTVEHFGHYAAMQAMGHGVGLADAFGSNVRESIAVPYVEFGQHSLQNDYF